MTLMSKLAALALSAAAMLDVHATPVVVNAQSAAQYRQAATTSTISAPAQTRAMARAPAPSSVPEPIHYKLMLLGLGLVLLFGRRGASRQKPWTKN